MMEKEYRKFSMKLSLMITVSSLQWSTESKSSTPSKVGLSKDRSNNELSRHLCNSSHLITSKGINNLSVNLTRKVCSTQSRAR